MRHAVGTHAREGRLLSRENRQQARMPAVSVWLRTTATLAGRVRIVGYCFWHPLRAPTLRGNASQLGLPLVLPIGPKGRGAGSLDVLEEQAWKISRR